MCSLQSYLTNYKYHFFSFVRYMSKTKTSKTKTSKTLKVKKNNMITFYHIHLGENKDKEEKPIKINRNYTNNNFDNNNFDNKLTDSIVFTKNDSVLYNSWLSIAKNTYGGQLFEIKIPEDMFEYDIKEQKSKKLLIVSKENHKEIKKQINKLGKNHESAIHELYKMGYCGIYDERKGTLSSHTTPLVMHAEGILWEIPNKIKVKIVNKKL